MQSIIARKKLQHSSQCQIYAQRITCRYDQTDKSKQLNVEYVYIIYAERGNIDTQYMIKEPECGNINTRCMFENLWILQRYKLHNLQTENFIPDLRIAKQVDVHHILHPEFVQANTIECLTWTCLTEDCCLSRSLYFLQVRIDKFL